ncbi:acyl-CoA--sterol O-acyltransferase 1-like [Andrographis paniculata]|uniref:acyl-CoA--sterol O-acyltransferase 1-like n=1 Tax=Andrographis paniculata TaxID=175694 RepID=UPI0021E7EEA4|nr:acyl-CoA--sterol O-acyltransferase 1-like [Andrographis paniculata]
METTAMVDVIRSWTSGEINNFIKIWLSAGVSLSYCFFSGKILRKGPPRLAAFLPVVFLFLLLPLHLRSVHLGGTTAFFLAWLANFKLLIFAFDQGPLSHPSISLPKFVAVACLPIRLHHRNPNYKSESRRESSAFNYAVKAALFAAIIKCYDYEDRIHPRIILVIYSFHIYFCLELILAVAAAVARALLAAELEPQFDEPYLSASLQDFWGHRWNLTVTRMLRPTVYLPVRGLAARLVGRRWALLPAVMSTFVVSGLMHELIFFYLGRVRPTWEITCFFVLHGACLVIEIVVKKAVGDTWRLPRIAGAILTVGFVMATGFWLFFPPLLRCKADERAMVEIAAVGAFVKDFVLAVQF